MFNYGAINRRIKAEFLDYGAAQSGRILEYVDASHVKCLAGCAFNVGGHLFIVPSDVNIGWSNLDAGSEANDTFYYVYACRSAGGLTFKVSTNSSVPTGFTAATSKRIGGFFNNSSGDIVSGSVWDIAQPLTNAAWGCTISASNWGTAPSNLNNAIDGDPSTVTGTGSKTTAGSATVGNVDLDFGEEGVYLISAKIGIWTDAGILYVYPYSKPDGSNWQHPGPHIAQSGSGTERVMNIYAFIASGQHFRLNFWVSAAATANVKIYQIWAYRLDKK